MQHNEALKLERELKEDFERNDAAVMNRLRAAVKEFLFEEASRLTGKIVRDEGKIKELIRIHAYVQILKVLIENPKSFGPKDLKEILKSGEAEVALLPATNDPLSAIQAMSGLSAAEKANYTRVIMGRFENEKMIEVEERVRRELSGG
jgi:uncharacterized membrane protein